MAGQLIQGAGHFVKQLLICLIRLFFEPCTSNGVIIFNGMAILRLQGAEPMG